MSIFIMRKKDRPRIFFAVRLYVLKFSKYYLLIMLTFSGDIPVVS